MTVLYGYKDDKPVVMIDDRNRERCCLIWPADASWSTQVRRHFNSLIAAKAAWRRFDGTGTRWYGHKAASGPIKRNAVRCRKCGEVIESKHRHDFVTCKCGAVSVDGGLDYLRRVGEPEDYEELSSFERPDA